MSELSKMEMRALKLTKENPAYEVKDIQLQTLKNPLAMGFVEASEWRRVNSRLQRKITITKTGIYFLEQQNDR